MYEHYLNNRKKVVNMLETRKRYNIYRNKLYKKTMAEREWY